MPGRTLTTAAAALAMVLALTACNLVEINLGPKAQPLVERTVSGQGRAKVLLIDVSGVMFVGAARNPLSPFGPAADMVSRLAEELDAARRDPDVKALLVRIDSPGGTVAAADLVHHELERYKKEARVPVVAAMMGVCASGGYYAAMAADRVTALPSTVTGSIGVISVKLDLSGIMDKVGVRTETVKTAVYKDMWSPFRPATEEERRLMQGLIDDFFRRFKEVVRQGRPRMTPSQLAEATTAKVFTASQALALGLIDQIAYPDEAVGIAKKMAGLTEARVVVYHRPGGYRPTIYSQADPALAPPSLTDLLPLAAAPQLMYLWLPGAR